MNRTHSNRFTPISSVPKALSWVIGCDFLRPIAPGSELGSGTWVHAKK